MKSIVQTTRLVAENGLYLPTASTGGGGGGITQLTGDVLAGPGTGSQAATVVRVNGATVPVAGALTPGDVLTVTGVAALAYLPPATTGITQLTGQVTAGPGTGSQAAKVAAQQANILYVSETGSDVSGNGNLFNPFATYNHAATVAIAGGAAEGNFWVVSVAPGTYAQAIALQPYVDLCGFDAANSLGFGNANATVLNGVVSLGSGFTGASPVFAGLSNVYLGSDITLNFLAAGATNGGVQISNSNIQNYTIIGSGLAIRGGLNTSTTGNVTVQDARLSTSSTEIGGNVSVTSPSFGSEVFYVSSFIDGSMSIDGSAGFPSTVRSLGSSIRSAIDLNGALATYLTAMEGLGNSIILSGGAAFPTIFGSGSALLGQILLADGGGGWTIGNTSNGAYTPGVPGNWAGAAPTTIQQALDRIAANTTNTHPIP